MDAVKTGFGLFRLTLPVLYCGGLLYYFFGVGGSIEGAQLIGLGPTLLGLGIVGLLFCIPLGLKIMRIFRDPPSSGSGGRSRAPTDDDRDGFDPDAAIARYMASKRSAESTPTRPAAPAAYSAQRPTPSGAGPAKPAGFGRRTR